MWGRHDDGDADARHPTTPRHARHTVRRTRRRTVRHALRRPRDGAPGGRLRARPARIRRTVRGPRRGDEREAAFLQDGNHADRAVTRLNAYLDLPDRVTVVARSCAGEGTSYDPAAHRIDLCYDDMAQDRELLTTDEKVGAIVAESVYHEAGHALVDTLELPVGPDPDEENTADRFAALMLLREGPAGERALRTAAEEYTLLAARDEDPDPGEDEHAPPADRAAAHLCLLHGAAPDRHPDLAARTRDCAPTWPTTRATWEHALAPLLR